MAKHQSSTSSPASVPEPQAAPMPQAYDPNMQYAQYQPVADPNKGKAKWLTFEYALAMFSVVTVAAVFVNALPSLFHLWVDAKNASIASAGVKGFLPGLLSVDMKTPATELVLGGVVAVMFAVLAMVLFGRVSRAIPEREGYTGRMSYKVATYGAMAAVVVPMIVLIAKMLTVLVASLLFIGTGGAGEIYKSLYLVDFLPYVIGAGLLGAIIFCIKGIISGRNTSKMLSMVLICAASALLLASSITVAVLTHQSPSKSSRDSLYSNSKNMPSMRDILSDY